MGSGKGGSPPEQPVARQAEPSVDYGPMFEAMGQMAAMNAALQAQSMDQMMAMQAMAPEPTAKAEPDWKARADALREKISASVTADAAARRGRESTILTSPLTDEKVKTTESVLTGS